MKKEKYTVKWALGHDKKNYEAGDVIELTDNVAEPLLVSGVIVSATEEAEQKADKDPKE